VAVFIKQDVFELDVQFKARRQYLLAKYNAAVQQRDANFQAGIGTLKK
jgi:hypothetical protein